MWQVYKCLTKILVSILDVTNSGLTLSPDTNSNNCKGESKVEVIYELDGYEFVHRATTMKITNKMQLYRLIYHYH